jgi:hypothetical protein
MEEFKKYASKILRFFIGIISEDSPTSAGRIGFFILIFYGMYVGDFMLRSGRPGLEVAAVLTAIFTPAAGLKIWSKRYEVQGYTGSYMKMTKSDEQASQ